MPILLVDTNSFHRPEVLSYLSASKGNRIAIAEEVLVEMHKKEPQVTVSKALASVRPFPTQIVILKGAAQLHNRPVKTAANARSIIDKPQTVRFADWYDEVNAGLLEDALAIKQAQAKSYIDDIKSQVGMLEPTFRKIKTRFSPEELKGLKTNRPASPHTQAKLIELMFDMSRAMFQASGVSEAQQPRLRFEAFDYFVFRYAM